MCPRIILVTGSSTGFGRAIVEQILSNGDIAVATLRKLAVLVDLSEKYDKDRLLVLPLDVTVKEQISAAFAEVKKVFGRLDAVISNAGVSFVGEIEASPEDAARPRTVFDVNVWGNMEVMKQAVAFFR